MKYLALYDVQNLPTFHLMQNLSSETQVFLYFMFFFFLSAHFLNSLKQCNELDSTFSECDQSMPDFFFLIFFFVIIII